MKITSWLISFIILVVTFTPCKDVHFSKDSTTPVISLKSQSDKEHSSIMDSCSPFCACACCSSPTVVMHQTLQQTIAVLLKKAYSDLYFANTASALIAIWQPPKLFS